MMDFDHERIQSIAIEKPGQRIVLVQKQDLGFFGFDLADIYRCGSHVRFLAPFYIAFDVDARHQHREFLSAAIHMPDFLSLETTLLDDFFDQFEDMFLLGGCVE